MVNFTTDELRLIAEKRGIKIYQNMLRKRLLSTLDKSERNFKNISLKGSIKLQKSRIFHKMSLSKSRE